MATKTVYIRMNDMTNVDGTPPDFRRKWFFASRAKANRPKHSRGGPYFGKDGGWYGIAFREAHWASKGVLIARLMQLGYAVVDETAE